MRDKQLAWKLVGFVLLIAAVLLVGAVNPQGARAAGPSCCQCPLPACGPARAGKCAPGCTLMAGATCNGKSGRCQVKVALQSPARDVTTRRLVSLNSPTNQPLAWEVAASQ